MTSLGWRRETREPFFTVYIKFPYDQTLAADTDYSAAKRQKMSREQQ